MLCLRIHVLILHYHRNKMIFQTIAVNKHKIYEARCHKEISVVSLTQTIYDDDHVSYLPRDQSMCYAGTSNVRTHSGCSLYVYIIETTFTIFIFLPWSIVVCCMVAHATYQNRGQLYIISRTASFRYSLTGTLLVLYEDTS